MTAERDVLAALERAVQAEPDSRALRLHVAGLLVAAGRHADALDHCATVLAAEPSNVTALDIAARAADAVGESARAAGYRQLVQALAGKPPCAAACCCMGRRAAARRSSPGRRLVSWARASWRSD